MQRHSVGPRGVRSSHPRVLFLDVDGVVLRNKKATGIINDRVLEYVKTRTNVSTYWEAKNINKIAYEKYGHTLIGLADMYPGLELSIEDFNDFVYTRGVISSAATSMGYDPYDRAPEDARRFLKYCSEVDIHPYLFSNATRGWIRMACDMYALDMPDDRILATDDPAPAGGKRVLKPDLASFARAGVRAISDHGEDSDIFFVDDSAANCFFSKHYMNWNTFRFRDGHLLSFDVVNWIGV
jgi:FMN phosphatase YigB (HAD superfamily)